MRSALALLPLALPLVVSASSDAHAAQPAAAYPTKAIRLVVISAPGGTTDILSRMLSQHMSEALGQQMVIDNRPGGGGVIAAEITAKSNPDGHTILYTHTSHSVLPSLHRKLPYDSVADFAPIGTVALFPGVLLINNALPIRSVKDLIAYAKARPGQVNFAAGTTGASAHLAGELFKTMAGINIVHIPYKGTGAQLTAVISGESQMTFASLPAAMPHVQSGRMRALAIGSARRSPALPDLPTVSEAALPGFDVSAWNGILAPRGTPRPIVDRLNQELRRFAASAEMKEKAAQQGAELVNDTPEEFTAYIRAQIAKWAPIVKAAGVKAD